MGTPVAIIDFSWILYKFRQYYKETCRFDYEGRYFPIGHVYGTIHVVQQLASQYKAVFLCVDSRSKHRYEVLPDYKSGRHSPTGDPYEDYKIMTDLMNILKLCTYQGNVFYIKHEGMESDDIIASWIASSGSSPYELYCYFNDVDILQTPGTYHWFRSFHEPEVDRRSYIKGKFGIDRNYLPIWWKVVRGDPSDGIPSSIPRFPSKKLVSICMSSAGMPNTVGWFSDQVGGGVSKDLIERNFQVISPNVVPVSDFKLKRLGCTEDEIKQLLQYYQIIDFVPVP